MAKVQVTNVTVLDNPTAFANPFQFDITFQCAEDLSDGKYLAIYFLVFLVLILQWRLSSLQFIWKGTTENIFYFTIVM